MLQSLPHRFFELHRLEELDLSYNLIAVLDSMLGKLKHLTFVNLEGNDLKGICPGIVRLSCQQLTKLRLDLNPMIHPLPGEISFAAGHVQRLQTLAGLALNAYVSDLKRALSLEMDGLWKQKVFTTALTDEIDDLQSMLSRMQSCVYKMTCGSCCWCSGVRLCDEMQVPWQNVTLAGYRSVPVIFNCCRQSCAVAASKCTPDDFAARFCSTLST
ncbi:unnamed protein product [Dicrocoelium dendriticum]|nr:unnamed protein product [Dicrocoelium dendriticum]